MQASANLRRRVVVIDPILRTREHLRRAVRALGHSPLVFPDLDELIQLRGGKLRCSVLCLGLPHDPAQAATWVRVARAAVGPGVPILFITREKSMKTPGIMRCVEGDLLLAAPVCFAELHEGLKAFLAQHAIPTVNSNLTWGNYKFIPSRQSVLFDDTEIHLRPIDFEIALEFFHNINTVLSREWLRSLASGLAPETGGRWLDGVVSRLRAHLGLAPFEGCEWQLSVVRYGGFKFSRVPGKKTTRPVPVALDRADRLLALPQLESVVPQHEELLSPVAPS